MSTEDKANKLWALVIILLVVIIIVGGILIWLRYTPSRPIEVSIPERQEPEGRVYINGAVNNPGAYPFTSKDSISSLLQMVGGTTDNATFNGIKLYVPNIGEIQEPQRIGINRAEVWLLEALPGIGKTLAQRIVDYRQQNGPFQNTHDITRVAGIDIGIFEKIKNLITVAD
ncbi:MAG: ComEA family DNA-binding protein [Chloroflexota bacterium]